MRKAKRLKLGDTIGVVAPAGPQERYVIEKGIDFLRNMGFEVKEGSHLYDRHGYLAGTDEARATDVMEMFMNPEIDAVFCMRGGYGTMRLLPFLDVGAIQRNPKIFVGYSDITTLLNTFAGGNGFVTFHGPMVTSDFSDEATRTSLFSTLMEGDRPYSLFQAGNSGIERLRATNCPVGQGIEGELVGGNLELIASLAGTPYEIDLKDKILFIEEVREHPYRVDRLLTHLLLSGTLTSCRGFIIGHFTACDAPEGQSSLTLRDVLEDRLESLGKPMLWNVPAGHEYPNFTLPIGARISVDFDGLNIHVLESVVE